MLAAFNSVVTAEEEEEDKALGLAVSAGTAGLPAAGLAAAGAARPSAEQAESAALANVEFGTRESEM
jgi:hypothetical protein